MLVHRIIALAAAASLGAAPALAQPLRAGSATLTKPSVAGKRLGQRVVEPAEERVAESSRLQALSLPFIFIAAAATAAAATVVIAATNDSSPN